MRKIESLLFGIWKGLKIVLLINGKNDKLTKMNKIEEQLKKTKEK
ncbi:MULTISPECIES: hypothetical protein [Bacteria]|nr:hypothetical protein [Cetobacterium somerae]WVJ03152.1 hypothetical protein VSU16_14605 [Cetobacterium somerae]